MPNPTYRGLSFPPYQFREYPKMIEGRTVNNQKEEDELRALLELEETGNAHRSNTPHSKRPNPLRS